MLVTLRLYSLEIAKDKTGLFIIFHFGNFKVYCFSFDLAYLHFSQGYFILQTNFLIFKQTNANTSILKWSNQEMERTVLS